MKDELEGDTMNWNWRSGVPEFEAAIELDSGRRCGQQWVQLASGPNRLTNFRLLLSPTTVNRILSLDIEFTSLQPNPLSYFFHRNVRKLSSLLSSSFCNLIKV